MDPGLNSLLKWSIENSDASQDGQTTSTASPASRSVNAEALNSLLGGPSDADLMKEAMVAILNKNIALEHRLTVWDNFEQLIEVIDNANNMEPLGLWSPLVDQLGSDEADTRRMAAWCIGTAVQNNIKAQEKLLVFDAIPKLIKLAVGDPEQGVRRKSVYALSSAVRNYQPAMDEATAHLPKDVLSSKKVSAGDMEAIDGIIEKLRSRST